MTAVLREWVLGMTGAAVFCAFAMSITPKGPVKKVVQMLCGVVMAAVLLAPLGELNFSDYGINLAKYRSGAEEFTGAGEALRESLDRSIIEEKTEAYILDKAKNMGAELSGAKVTMQWSMEGFWYPVGAELSGQYHEALSRLLESELGIAQKEQRWIADENP